MSRSKSLTTVSAVVLCPMDPLSASLTPVHRAAGPSWAGYVAPLWIRGPWPTSAVRQDIGHAGSVAVLPCSVSRADGVCLVRWPPVQAPIQSASLTRASLPPSLAAVSRGVPLPIRVSNADACGGQRMHNAGAVWPSHRRSRGDISTRTRPLRFTEYAAHTDFSPLPPGERHCASSQLPLGAQRRRCEHASERPWAPAAAGETIPRASPYVALAGRERLHRLRSVPRDGAGRRPIRHRAHRGVSAVRWEGLCGENALRFVHRVCPAGVARVRESHWGRSKRRCRITRAPSATLSSAVDLGTQLGRAPRMETGGSSRPGVHDSPAPPDVVSRPGTKLSRATGAAGVFLRSRPQG